LAAVIAVLVWALGVHYVVEFGAPVAAMVVAAAPVVCIVGLVLHHRHRARRAASPARLNDRSAN
jgi:hypothetical protein